MKKRVRAICLALALCLLLCACGSAPQRPVERDPEPTKAAREDPAEASGEDPAEAPGEEPGEAPGEEPGEASGEEPGETPAAEPVEVLDPEETKRLLEEKYGVKTSGASWAAAGSVSIYSRIEPLQDVEYTLPAAYPAEVAVTVTAPDLDAMLRGMDAADYADAAEFRDEVLRRLSAGEYTERSETVTVTVTGPDFDPAKTEDYALLNALYGGALDYYRELMAAEYAAYYAALREGEGQE